MNADSDAGSGVNWDCPQCGRHMTPHGDCPSCYKKERARQIAAGEIKRAKDIKVGDVISTRWSFKIDPITVHTIEVTPRGKVVINRGRTAMGGEDVFEGEQWIDIVGKAKVEDTLDQIITELETGLNELDPESDFYDRVSKKLHPHSNAHRSYHWPLRYKLPYSLFLILSGIFYIFVIIWLKVGAFLGVKSYQNKYVPVLFCGLVPVFHDWDRMWKENPPSHY